VLDEVYRSDAEGEPESIEAAAPTDEALHALPHTVIARLMKMLTRRGVLVEDTGPSWLAEADADGDAARTLRPLQAAAVTYRIAFGSRAGQRVLTLRGDARCDRPGSPARPRRAGTARRFDDARLRPGGRRCPQETGDRPARQGPLCIAVSTAPGTSMSISNPRRDMGRQTAARYRACDLTGRRD
jgi:hypothetical protein